MYLSKDLFVHFLSFFSLSSLHHDVHQFFVFVLNKKKKEEKKNLSSLTIMLILYLPASIRGLSLCRVPTVALTTLTHLL